MITKREKLQYIYVFLTDLVVLLLSTLLAWLVTDGLLKQLVPYAPSDWVQTICLLMLAFVATFICFDQTENIVTRTSGEEIKLSIKFNVLLALVYSTAMLLTKAEMLDSRYFTLAVPAYQLCFAAHRPRAAQAVVAADPEPIRPGKPGGAYHHPGPRRTVN